jgi:hypothetical protein
MLAFSRVGQDDNKKNEKNPKDALKCWFVLVMMRMRNGYYRKKNTHQAKRGI